MGTNFKLMPTPQIRPVQKNSYYWRLNIIPQTKKMSVIVQMDFTNKINVI
jgi:hypothetical protein